MKKILAIIALALFLGGIGVPVIAAELSTQTMMVAGEDDPATEAKSETKSETAKKSGECEAPAKSETAKKSGECEAPAKSETAKTEAGSGECTSKTADNS